MADPENPQGEYNLVPEGGGKPLKVSWGYTGRGVATYPNGDIYDGDFKEGHRTGKGTYTYSSKGTEEAKDTYVGDWVKNKKHGIGI